jgi:hypothetical protein
VRRTAASPRRALLAGLAVLLALAGCSDEAGEADQASAPPQSKTATELARQRQQPARPRPVHCPPALANCSTASGRIIYIERVDPDGDRDAHFVIASSDSITAPGISVIDLRKSLRPSPLPGPGDWISAAGPVYKGSHGQSQIEAVRVQVRRRN